MFAVAARRILPVYNSVNRDTVITNPYDGYAVYRRDTNRIEVFNGISWDAFPVDAIQSINGASNTPATPAGVKEQSGTFPALISGSNADIGSFTFPVPFNTAPSVQLTVQVGGNLDLIANLTGGSLATSRPAPCSLT